MNRTLVGNLGRNIIRKLVVKLEGNEIIRTDDYDILYSYYDWWKCKTERLNAVFPGIVEADGQTENAIKPLDFEILESSLPLYQYGLGSHLTYELTFANDSDVIKATDPDATYTISNISLEFDTIINASLASQIRTEYMKSSILYDRILRAPSYHSISPIQASPLTSIVHQKVLRVSYSYSHKKEVLLNLQEIPKNFTTLR